MPQPATPSLQDLLRELREQRGQSLRHVAREIAVDPAHLSRVERGTKPASPEMLERASRYYNIPRELLALSRGVVPSDVISILQHHPEVVDDLRQRYGSS